MAEKVELRIENCRQTLFHDHTEIGDDLIVTWSFDDARERGVKIPLMGGLSG